MADNRPNRQEDEEKDQSKLPAPDIDGSSQVTPKETKNEKLDTILQEFDPLTSKFNDDRSEDQRTEAEGSSWSFTPFSGNEIEYPEIDPVPQNHVVLSNIKDKGSNGNARKEMRDAWDGDHVRMPCSKRNKRPKESKPKWDFIRKSLTSPRIETIWDLIEAIKSYNKTHAITWSFLGLKEIYNQNEQLFKETVPKITKLALELPELISQPIPLLRQNKELSLSLSQMQIASLLANAFLCTFPWRNDTRSSSSEYSNFPNINFSSLFQDDTRQVNVEKIKCIFNYFKRVGDKSPEGVVTFTRRVLDDKDKVDWKKSDKTLCVLDITSSGSIETDGEGMLQVDFANKFVGGGVLSKGCVQEEIRFIINPEMIVSRLFTEKLLDNEAMVITGSERFNQYTGYSHTFKWKSDFIDKTPFDENNRRKCSIVAIDARDYKHNPSEQYSTRFIERDLNKAYVGFYNKDVGSNNLLPVATGNWGCGAFKGDPTLKALIQWMAASQAGRTIKYFTFGGEKLVEEINRIIHLLDAFKPTVGQLYNVICNYGKDKRDTNLSRFVEEQFLGASDVMPNAKRGASHTSAANIQQEPRNIHKNGATNTSINTNKTRDTSQGKSYAQATKNDSSGVAGALMMGNQGTTSNNVTSTDKKSSQDVSPAARSLVTRPSSSRNPLEPIGFEGGDSAKAHKMNKNDMKTNNSPSQSIRDQIQHGVHTGIPPSGNTQEKIKKYELINK